jgi:Prophage minor tail protein Z (GPZ)
MPLELTVTFDVRAAVYQLRAFSSPQLQRATAQALNDTAKNAQVQAVKETAPKLGLPSRDVKAATKIATATTGHLQSAVIATGRPLPLIRFKPKGGTRRTPVTVKIAGKTDTFSHAFKAKLKSGYEGIWERKGRTRGPIKQLYGPSVPGIMARDDVSRVVAATIERQFQANLKRQMDRQVRAAKGLAGSRSR